MSQPCTPLVEVPRMAPGFLDFIQMTAPVTPTSPLTPPLAIPPRGRSATQEARPPSVRSRACSASSTSSVPNFSRVMSQRKASVPDLPRLTIDPLPLPRRSTLARRANTVIKRWDGATRRATKWDCLRRDSELYDPHASCAIHFHAKGRSQRGPSLRVPFDVVAKSGCLSALRARPEQQQQQHHHQPSPISDSPASDSGYSSHGSTEDTHNLFIGPPDYLTRDEALQWHMTTRNVFAWMMDKPLVGYSLGRSLIDLLERLLTIRSATADSVDDVIAYADRMGYTDMTSQPDYALAMLCFAEHYRLRDLWTNAFVHCAGMNDILYQSSELASISRQTQASITKTYLKMDLKVTKVTRAMTNFLEEDLSPAKLGLTISQRAHLDRFRSFLNSFYVGKLGYWPPPEYTMDLFHAMRYDFECLYDLLVDKESFPHLPNATSGGLCVLQNVSAFDTRHDFQPLDHPLPLNPQHGALDSKSLSARGLRSLLNSKSSRRNLLASARTGLDGATNKIAPHVTQCALVKSYLSFELDGLARLEPDLAIADARKVRWIHIYYTLQMLRSITTSPPSFNPTSCPYHTCPSIPAIPWTSTNRNSILAVHPALRSPAPSDRSTPTTPPLQTPQSIHPDCVRDDYFSSSTSATSTPVSANRDPFPLPLKVSSPTLTRAASVLSRRASFLSSRSRTTKRGSQVFSPVSREIDEEDEDETSSTIGHVHMEKRGVNLDDEGDEDEEGEEVFELDAGPRTPTLDCNGMMGMVGFGNGAFGPFELDAVEPGMWLEDESEDEAGEEGDEHEVFEWGLTKGHLCVYDGIETARRHGTGSDGSVSDGEDTSAVGSSASEYSDGTWDSEGTTTTALTPVLESPGSAGSERWAGGYRDCIGKGREAEEDYFEKRGGRYFDIEEEEADLWIDIPTRRY
ncbi:hypothetical protein CAC42_1232 [Sphaceloma murrayae]|uniref:DUF8004 domain-containing protein n=1 Tax=Sphaceloma murrayae TaxID=2082308 RepID=A0A2K1R2N6_9PEZI|nr:hypothetical protein CAC42_1232 [Sphaceloma murrayae]